MIRLNKCFSGFIFLFEVDMDVSGTKKELGLPVSRIIKQEIQSSSSSAVIRPFLQTQNDLIDFYTGKLVAYI